MLRSTGFGTTRVHRSLNQTRAITLCWIANNPRSAPSISNAFQRGPGVPVLMAFGTTKSPRKPICIPHQTDMPTFEMLTKPTELQQRAFNLLNTAIPTKLS